MPRSLDTAFENAKQAYPKAWVSGQGTETFSLFGDDEEEIEVPHTYQLVDVVAASFRCPEREGMLVLQEHRPGCSTPFNHWGYMVSKAEMTEAPITEAPI